MDLFAGTAQYYDEFRPGVPQAVLDCVVQAVPVPVSLLDLGTGTGRITEQFAPYFDDIIAVEPDRDMAKIARHRLQNHHAAVLEATAERAELPAGWQTSLVTICRAFHWMDQPVVLARLEKIVAADGVIAIMSDNSFWHLTNDWGVVVKETLQHFLGPERRTLMGTYKKPRDFFGEYFTSPIFTNLERHTIPVTRQWTADQIVGYLYSTSFASHAVLGDAAPAFEKLLRQRLAALSPSDLFTEHNEFDILLARREQP